jgi:hypothetical protein
VRERSSGKLVTQALWIAAFAVFLTLLGTVTPAAIARHATSRQEHESCPRHAPEHVGPNHWSRAERVLAPRGVFFLNLCRYASTSTFGGKLKLAGNKVVDKPRTIRQLMHKFDALKAYHGPPLHCPADPGDVVFATLYYRWHTVKIVVHLRGCPFASNGDLNRAAFNFHGKNPAGPKLLKQLKRLTYRVYFPV